MNDRQYTLTLSVPSTRLDHMTSRDTIFHRAVEQDRVRMTINVYQDSHNGIQVSWYAHGVPTVTAWFKGELLAALIEAAGYVEENDICPGCGETIDYMMDDESANFDSRGRGWHGRCWPGDYAIADAKERP
jgi:hypothetical protein